MKSATARALAPDPAMVVHSDLLGPLSVSADEVIAFPAGLFGFPECRSFVLVPAAREGMFWLQSVEHGTLVFLLADPFLFFDGYAVDLSPADRAELHAGEASEVVVLAIVTLPRAGEATATANLLGPLALNLRARAGRQLAVADARFGVRTPLDLARGG